MMIVLFSNIFYCLSMPRCLLFFYKFRYFSIFLDKKYQQNINSGIFDILCHGFLPTVLLVYYMRNNKHFFFFSREFSLPSRQNNWSLKDKTIRIVDKKPFRFVLDLVLACVLVQFIIEQNHRSNISFDTSFYKFFFSAQLFVLSVWTSDFDTFFYGELERNIIELLLNLLNWQRKTGCCFGVELGKWAEKFLKSFL